MQKRHLFNCKSADAHRINTWNVSHVALNAWNEAAPSHHVSRLPHSSNATDYWAHGRCNNILIFFESANFPFFGRPTGFLRITFLADVGRPLGFLILAVFTFLGRLKSDAVFAAIPGWTPSSGLGHASRPPHSAIAWIIGHR